MLGGGQKELVVGVDLAEPMFFRAGEVKSSGARRNTLAGSAANCRVVWSSRPSRNLRWKAACNSNRAKASEDTPVWQSIKAVTCLRPGSWR